MCNLMAQSRSKCSKTPLFGHIFIGKGVCDSAWHGEDLGRIHTIKKRKSLTLVHVSAHNSKTQNQFHCKMPHLVMLEHLWSVQSSGVLIGRYRAVLVFYARIKSRAAFAKAFVRGQHRSMSAYEIGGTLNAPLVYRQKNII